MTGKSIDDITKPTPMKKKQKNTDPDLPTKRKVKFNLKLNTTKIFDKKEIIRDSTSFQSAISTKSILKKVSSEKIDKPKKRQKTVSF